ncbi:MAG: FUN14 domain-containing protein [Planctomycetota bacterium]
MPDDTQSEDTAPQPSAKSRGRVIDDLLGLSRWRKGLMTLFTMIAVAGGAMWGHAKVTTPSPESDPAYLQAETMPDGAAGFVGDGASDRTIASSAEVEPELPWYGRLGGWGARLGFSFVVGLLVGVFFRSFLKTMAALTAVAVAAIVGLSYFNVLDVDTTILRENYDSAAEWTKGQAGGVKDIVMRFLPSTVASTAGFAVGFLRR